jgi:hypothetical protein
MIGDEYRVLNPALPTEALQLGGAFGGKDCNESWLQVPRLLRALVTPLPPPFRYVWAAAYRKC